jgi:hypothetical protein
VFREILNNDDCVLDNNVYVWKEEAFWPWHLEEHHGIASIETQIKNPSNHFAIPFITYSQAKQSCLKVSYRIMSSLHAPSILLPISHHTPCPNTPPSSTTLPLSILLLNILPVQFIRITLLNARRILRQNSLFDEILRLWTVRDLLVERVGAHVLFEFALLALDCGGCGGGRENVAFKALFVSNCARNSRRLEVGGGR